MLKDWIWLTTRKGLGARGVLQVLDYFGSPERAFYADPEQYDQIPGLSALARSALREKGMEGPDRIGECDRLGLRVLTLQDGDYPERLREIPDPPAVLYVRGTLFHFDQEAAIGIVGAREPSPYGEKVAAQLGLELARNGVLLVSGIAQGIDSIALKGALQGGGRVVSVLAGGVDVPYPWQNRYLYEDVAAAGALISEYPPGTRHNGEHFPVRNRIISGLALGVVAVECARHSGTMLTVNHAMEQNRDVFAIPGNIDAPMSEGPNWLLRQGQLAAAPGGPPGDLRPGHFGGIRGPLPGKALQGGPPVPGGRPAAAGADQPPGGAPGALCQGGGGAGGGPQGAAEGPLYRRPALHPPHTGGEAEDLYRRRAGGADPDPGPAGAVRPHYAPGGRRSPGAPGAAVFLSGEAGGRIKFRGRAPRPL